MSEPAPASELAAPAIDAWYFEHIGRALLNIGLPRPPKFKTVAGGRRMLGERTPGRATLTVVKKENC